MVLFTCAHCSAYEELPEDVFDLESGSCFACSKCGKDTVILLADVEDYCFAANAIAAQHSVHLTAFGAGWRGRLANYLIYWAARLVKHGGR